MRDNVTCCNCGWRGTVATGQEDCPKCKRAGFLAWAENEPPEVPDA